MVTWVSLSDILESQEANLSHCAHTVVFGVIAQSELVCVHVPKLRITASCCSADVPLVTFAKFLNITACLLICKMWTLVITVQGTEVEYSVLVMV